MTFYMSYLVGRYVKGNIGMGYVVGSIVGLVTYYSVILVMIHVYDRTFNRMIYALGKDQIKDLLSKIQSPS